MKSNKGKWIKMVVAGLIAACIAKVSFAHTVHIAETHGQAHDNALLYPVIVEATMIYCATILSGGPINRMTKFWCRVGMYLGIIANLGANLFSCDMSDTLTAVIAIVPGVFLYIVVEIILNSAKSIRSRR